MNLFTRSAVVVAAAFLALAANAFPIATPGTEGFLVVVTSTNNVIATYEGNSAAFSNDLYLVNTGMFVFNNHASPVGSTVDLGSFAVGTELLFMLHVNDTGFDYFTGPGTRNPDGHTHARVQDNWLPSVTLVSFEDLFNGPFDYNDLSFSFTNTGSSSAPEPATYSLMLGGLAVVGWLTRRRRS